METEIELFENCMLLQKLSQLINFKIYTLDYKLVKWKFYACVYIKKCGF